MHRPFALSLLAAVAVSTLAAPAIAEMAQVQTRYVKIAPGVPGVLYEPAADAAKKGIAIFVMHANNDYLSFPPRTQLSQRGYTVPCANNSTNKINAVDEGQLDRILAEAKEGVVWLRKQPGIQKVILFGHSGGATIMSAYQMIAENGVASCQQAARLSKYPDNLAGMPAADGVMLIDSNWGHAGMVLLSLDASIVDEADGKRTDPSLDIYASANGWSKEGAHYSPAFVVRYQKQQSPDRRSAGAGGRDRCGQGGLSRRRSFYRAGCQFPRFLQPRLSAGYQPDGAYAQGLAAVEGRRVDSDADRAVRPPGQRRNTGAGLL
ncbi:hypothetical protein SAMN05518849_10833 [Sphingobium sp. AP50]|uniref:hypothetical protein n=1 Tax=Sphingobium sp. AP50 TaxID=1884369 RepID=UPI0008C84CCB|nr:hypothetical protein [Sphingobium sp. AP50]SEJ53045.1 hypothetical protein SAMN05518849_10833 [Sphingobium sp. AP50]